MEDKKFVVVTTDKKGVFAGFLLEHDKEKETCMLKNAKMCVYWCSAVKGVLGLASSGPIRGCKITRVIPSIYLNGITSVMDCTQEAQENWGKEIWS